MTIYKVQTYIRGWGYETKAVTPIKEQAEDIKKWYLENKDYPMVRVKEEQA